MSLDKAAPAIGIFLGIALGVNVFGAPGSSHGNADLSVFQDAPSKLVSASSNRPIHKSHRPTASEIAINKDNPWPRNTVNELLYSVGFRGERLFTMSAITMGESNGNRLAHNCNASTGDDSRGILQINTLGSLIGRLDTYNLVNEQALYDQKRNAQIAYELSNSPKGFGHWGAYNNKSYLKRFNENPVIKAVRNANCPA